MGIPRARNSEKTNSNDRLFTKGQLILKSLFAVIIWTKIAMKILSRFLPWNLASWGLTGDLVCNYKEAYKKPQKAFMKPKEATKIFRAEILRQYFVAILIQTMTPKRHFEINWSLSEVCRMKSKRNIYNMYPCLFPCSTSMKFRKSVVCHTASSFGPWIGNNSNVLFNVTVFCSLRVQTVEGKWICKKLEKQMKK